MESKLKVLLLSAEVVPFAKTGGLADVAGSLPKVLKAEGCDIRVSLPKYKQIQVIADLRCPMGDRVVEGQVETLTKSLNHDIPVYFIKNDHYYNRDSIYCHYDEAERFIFYQRAVLEMLKALNWKPDVIHCNDWQTGLIPVYLKTIYADDPFYSDIATVFTIHNLAYQGTFDSSVLPLTGIGWEHFNPKELEFYGQINMMKGGLVFADVLNTVSEKYAEEIQTEEFGERLEGVLRERRDSLFGVLNGIDYDVWNPATDANLVAPYDLASIERKGENKRALQKAAGLPEESEIPLVGLISRLSEQKGFDILAKGIDKILQIGLQLVVLGTGDPFYMDLFRDLAKRYPRQVATFLKFDERLAHQIYAGSDLFLMPSRYEPCGLSQMISLRYGTIPIVRATGGLADTIREFNPKTGEGNGFSFAEYSPEALIAAVERAVAVFHDKESWRRLQANAMQCDFSWQRSARKYIELYQRAIKARRERKKAVAAT